jgi:hypothetical protein
MGDTQGVLWAIDVAGAVRQTTVTAFEILEAGQGGIEILVAVIVDATLRANAD